VTPQLRQQIYTSFRDSAINRSAKVAFTRFRVAPQLAFDSRASRDDLQIPNVREQRAIREVHEWRQKYCREALAREPIGSASHAIFSAALRRLDRLIEHLLRADALFTRFVKEPNWSPDEFYSQWEENALAANPLLGEIDDLDRECGLFHMWKSETDEQQEQVEQQIGFRYSEQHFSYHEIRQKFLRERAKRGAPTKDRSLFRKALDMRLEGKSYAEILAEICDCGAMVHDEKQMELCSDRFSKGVTAIRKSLKNYPDIHVPEWC